MKQIRGFYAGILAMAVAVITILSVSITTQAATTKYELTVEQRYDLSAQIVNLVNAERAKMGLSALKSDSSLQKTAMLRATESIVLFSHTRPNGEKCYSASGKMYGENIAEGYPTPDDVMKGWMNSPGHRANILKEGYTILGVGAVVYNGRMYWAQNFGYDDAEYGSQSNGSVTYSIDVNESFVKQQGVDLSKFKKASVEVNNAGVPVYRVYNPKTQEHMYTISASERADKIRAGWNDENIGWYTPSTSGKPIYRLYHPGVGDRHYTINADERTALINQGWRDEGIAWYSSETGTPLYRLCFPGLPAHAHHYTSDANEKRVLLTQGWRDEGIGWYAL